MGGRGMQEALGWGVRERACAVRSKGGVARDRRHRGWSCEGRGLARRGRGLT